MHSSGFGGVATLRAGMLEQLYCATCGGVRYVGSDSPVNIDDHCVCADGPCVAAGIIARKTIGMSEAIAFAAAHDVEPRKNQNCIAELEKGGTPLVVVSSDGEITVGYRYLALAAWWSSGERLPSNKQNKAIAALRIDLVEEK